METEDQFDLDATPEEGEDSPTFANVRSWGKEQQKARKTAEKENATLKANQDKLLGALARTTFKAAGFSDRLADLYVKANPDLNPLELTEDKVKEFAQEYGITVTGEEPTKDEPEKPEASEGEEESETKEPETPAPTFRPGGGGNQNPQDAIKMDDIIAAARRGGERDMAWVEKVVAEEAARPGRIEWKYPELHEE